MYKYGGNGKMKIIALCVCMLLIITTVPAVEVTKNRVINPPVRSLNLSTTTTNKIQEQNLFHSDDSGILYFEYCAALDGNTAVVGTYRADTPYGWAGSVYIFTRTNNLWTQQQRIFAPTLRIDMVLAGLFLFQRTRLSSQYPSRIASASLVTCMCSPVQVLMDTTGYTFCLRW